MKKSALVGLRWSRTIHRIQKRLSSDARLLKGVAPGKIIGSPLGPRDFFIGHKIRLTSDARLLEGPPYGGGGGGVVRGGAFDDLILGY